MIKVAHRVNEKAMLMGLPIDIGVEVDIRSSGSNLILNHDYPAQGELLNDYLFHFNHSLLVLNVKEDGLEEAILQLENFQNVKNYFFLDQSFPTMIKSSRNGISTSIRVSEYEELPRTPTGAKWVWIDSFSGNWEHLPSTLLYAESFGLKTCLVAPELQRRFDKSESMELLSNYQKRLDAVCTKNLDFWQ